MIPPPPPITTTKHWGFPEGPAVKNTPANAGGTGFDPQSGRIPHVMEQLSLCATNIEAHVP